MKKILLFTLVIILSLLTFNHVFADECSSITDFEICTTDDGFNPPTPCGSCGTGICVAEVNNNLVTSETSCGTGETLEDCIDLPLCESDGDCDANKFCGEVPCGDCPALFKCLDICFTDEVTKY